jgi:hypothetical protein
VAGGLLLLTCGSRSIRFRPPLNLSAAEADAGLEIVRQTLRICEERSRALEEEVAMIEREAAIKIYNEALGAKGAKADWCAWRPKGSTR